MSQFIAGSNGFSFKGDGSGLTFVGSENNGLFAGKLQPKDNTDPASVYEWHMPSLLIDYTKEGSGLVARIPVGSVHQLAASLGVSQVVNIAPNYQHSPNWYASGFYDTLRNEPTASDPLVALVLKQNTISFEVQ